ncbi:hypothetical protein MOTC310_08005 [Methylobacterium oryzae]|uniref:Uncharacterized protein n=2 Tax=Methylobacterium oryzae TaxID=334852 RepID=A0ABU7TLM6_9HYPH
MRFRLTIWSRAGEVRSTTTDRDPAVVWDAWTRRDERNGFGLVSQESEGQPSFPDKRAFTQNPVLITEAAHQTNGGFVTAPMGGQFAHLHAIRRWSNKPLPVVEPSAPDLGSSDLPVLPQDVTDAIRDVEVTSLTGDRRLRTALVRLDVRLGADLAGMTEADILLFLGGSRKLLDTFRAQAKAFTERQAKRSAMDAEAAAAEARAAEQAARDKARVARKAATVEAEAVHRAARAEAFASTPLLETITSSLGHLDPRSRGILTRKLGLRGRPETVPEMLADFDVNRSRLFQIVESSVALLDKRDGWPSRLGKRLSRLLPVTGEEIASTPWLSGLDPERLTAIAWFGAKARVHLVETSMGPVVGPLRTGDWLTVCRDARKLVLASDLATRPEQFRERLRAGLPEGAEGYERFLLREIGWPSEPGVDWLLHLKGRISTSAMVRDVAGHVAGPLATGELIEAVRTYAPDASAKTIRGILGGEARHLPDGTWERRRRWDADDPAVGKVERACIRFLEGQPQDAATLRPAALAEAIADDPELAGIEVDADIVALAVRSSTRFEPRSSGWIVLADRDPTADIPSPR